MSIETDPPAKGEAIDLLTPESRARFSASYPEVPHRLQHNLHHHPLLEFDRLAKLAEALPKESVEYNLADLPIAVDGKPDRPDMTIGEMIRQIGTAGSWCVLQNIEQDPEYAQLLNDLLDDVMPQVEAKTGRMMHRVGFIFVTSPGGVTPCHFDPEHNILLQIRGSKVMTQFPVTDTAYAKDEAHEGYHTGGPREVPWNERLERDGTEMPLAPGEGLFVPVMAPHFVKNGPEPSISLSITWRSDWSYEEADARAFNSLLRKLGLNPKAPGRWPKRNRVKAIGWRLYRKFVKSN
ncbi:MAG: cupin-like domain-containing protein [Novosphingobium sp.]|nr:cupin-like domain-containing protein [Novosphingobium sp.]MBO9600968.1 cupin-like domain-containing protein [Novosphingobium sp.]